EYAAGYRQHHALREQLADDAPASGSQSGANRDFASAPSRPGQQQIRDVSTSDQEHETDRAQQDPQECPHAADEYFTKGFDPKALLWPHALREPAPEGVRRGFKLGVCYRQRNTRFEPGPDVEIVSLLRAIGIEPEGKVDFRGLVDFNLQIVRHDP